MDLHCVLCGGRLYHEDDELFCSECGASYESVLLSKTRIEENGRVVTELSLSMDFSLVERREEPALFQEVSRSEAVEALV